MQETGRCGQDSVDGSQSLLGTKRRLGGVLHRSSHERHTGTPLTYHRQSAFIRNTF